MMRALNGMEIAQQMVKVRVTPMPSQQRKEHMQVWSGETA